tara:strand:+ start:164 stop:592 length:429 start_codon:yes stop_codon:yes gene_type:complete
MATLNSATNYLEHNLLNFIFKNNSNSFATLGNSIYVGLATAVANAETGSLTEANFGSYARQQVNSANWTLTASNVDSQVCNNTGNIEWSASSGTNNTVTHVFLADALTDGNILFVGQLDSPRTIQQGDIFRINATNLSFELK